MTKLKYQRRTGHYHQKTNNKINKKHIIKQKHKNYRIKTS